MPNWEVINSLISTSFEEMYSYSWTGDIMLLILKKETNKEKRKTRKQTGNKIPRFFF